MYETYTVNTDVKGELNPKIKLDFFTLINKYTLICSNFAWLKRNFQISKSFYLLTNYAKNRTIFIAII